MLFTTNQKKAHDFSRHISLSSGAGSGKTAVLVSRYLRVLLETSAKTSNIVAITFTEKSAAELKNRIKHQIDSYLAEGLAPIGLEQIKSEINQSNISTIHSFCSRILQEFPTESGVPVGFTVIEPFEQRKMLSEAIQTRMAEIAEDSKKNHNRKDLAVLLRNLGRSKLETMLLRCFEQLNIMGQIINLYETCPDDSQIIERWQTAIDNEIFCQVDIQKFIDDLEQLTKYTTGKKANRVKEIISELSLDTRLRLEQLRTASHSILTRSGSISKRDFLGVAAQNSELELLIEQVEVAAKVINMLSCTNETDQFLIKIIRSLLNLFRQTEFQYELQKKQKYSLDFSDLQIYFRNLLRNNRSIRKQLQQRYQYIMVDEYQDTNQIQFEILGLLSDNFQSGNLFIVGDPKQSIYGFRGADVSVFNQTTGALGDFQKKLNRNFVWRDLQSVTTQYLPATKKEKSGQLSLVDNFRLTRNLVGFVNLVFSYLMKGHPEMPYQPLVWGRKSSLEGKIEVLIGANKRNEDEAEILDENRLIARRIRHLIATGILVAQERADRDCRQPIGYKDIAIIIRSRTHLPDIENALLEESVPYQITGGIGFYQRQEIYDLVNYLHFLEDPTNSLALVGILRSPFFGLSDGDLFSISQVENVEEFWNKFLVYQSEIASSNTLNYVSKILKSHLSICHRVPISTLIRRIVNETGMIGVLSVGRQGEQKWANYQKLLQIAREFDKNDNASLSSFLHQLDLLMDTENQEEQAKTDNELDRVQIMTIHASKGLEFPVVFLPHLSRRLRPENEPYFHAEYGIGFDVSSKDSKSEFYSEDNLTPAILNLMKKKATARMIAEEKRLFYVAVTRARDRLILAGTSQKNSNSLNYLNWLFDALDLHETPTDFTKVWPVTVTDLEGRDHQFELPIQFTKHIDLETTNPETGLVHTLVDLTQSEIDLEPVVTESEERFYTVSALATLAQCETKFYLRHHVIGSDLTDFSVDSANILKNETGFENQVQKAFSQLRSLRDIEILQNQLPSNVWLHLETFTKSEIGKAVLDAQNAKTKMPIQAKIGSYIVHGMFDRLYKKTNGFWSIIQYKIDALELAPDLSESIDHLCYNQLQMELYAICLHKLYPEQHNVSTTLFFTKTGEVEVKNFSQLQLKNLEKKWVCHIDQLDFSDLNQNHNHCPNCPYHLSGNCLMNSI